MANRRVDEACRQGVFASHNKYLSVATKYKTIAITLKMRKRGFTAANSFAGSLS
jgi:hypothetical protein